MITAQITALDTPLPFRLLLPEILVATGMLGALLTSLVPGLRGGRTSLWLGVVAALAALLATLVPVLGTVDAMLVVDPTAAIARGAITLLLVLLLLAGTGELGSGPTSGRPTSDGATNDHDAWCTCVLGVGLGALLVASSTNLLPLWLGLELVSLGSYALTAWRGGDLRAAEAGMKYVLFGGAATGLMLFGMSHLYGLTGHFDFTGIGQALGHGMPLPVVATVCLAAIGIAYKLTVVPFHVYAPDVYQGAPPLSVAVVATLPKLAAGAVLLRALKLVVPASLVPTADVGGALAGIAMASLVVAALTAVAQREARRIIAFSGIGHGGTAVLAAAALPGPAATAAVLLHLIAYAVSAFGALVCLSVLERQQGSTRLDALPGALRRQPWVTGALCLFLASLAGIPPLAGFLGKWSVLDVALRGGPLQVAGAMALLATTAVFAWSYLLIVRAAVLAPAPDTPGQPAGRVSAPTAIVLGLAAACVVGLGLWLDVLAQLARCVQT